MASCLAVLLLAVLLCCYDSRAAFLSALLHAWEHIAVSSCFVMGGRHLGAAGCAAALCEYFMAEFSGYLLWPACYVLTTAPEAGAPMCKLPASCCHHDMFLCLFLHRHMTLTLLSVPACLFVDQLCAVRCYVGEEAAKCFFEAFCGLFS